MKSSRPYVLDSGALVAIEKDPRGDVARRCRADSSFRQPPILPTVVFAQVWRASARQHALALLRRSCREIEFTAQSAEAVGRLLARSRTAGIVDAAVVVAALVHGADVLTSDPDDITRLADAAGVPLGVVPV